MNIQAKEENGAVTLTVPSDVALTLYKLCANRAYDDLHFSIARWENNNCIADIADALLLHVPGAAQLLESAA